MVRKSTPRFTKSLSLVLIRLVLTEIQRFKKVKINKKCMATGPADAVSYGVRMAILFYGCISVKTSPINTKLGDFVKLGLHFMSVWINSC